MFENSLKTGLLMTGLVALFVAIGGLFGREGALIGLLIAGGMSFSATGTAIK